MINIILTHWLEVFLTTIVTSIAYLFKQYTSIKKGVKVLLRNEIVDIYETYSKLEYCPSYMKDNVKEIYESYHKLKGNGMTTFMVNELYKLPNDKYNK